MKNRHLTPDEHRALIDEYTNEREKLESEEITTRDFIGAGLVFLLCAIVEAPPAVFLTWTATAAGWLVYCYRNPKL